MRREILGCLGIPGRANGEKLITKKIVAQSHNIGAILHNKTLYVRDTNKKLKSPRWVKSCLTLSDLGDNVILTSLAV